MLPPLEKAPGKNPNLGKKQSSRRCTTEPRAMCERACAAQNSPPLPPASSCSMSFVYALFSPFLLKSSTCAKLRRFAMSFSSAGGYWPTQYQLPGASQILFLGSATHALLSSEMFMTLNTRIKPCCVVCPSLNNCWLALTPSMPCFTSLYSNDLAIMGVGDPSL